MHGLRLKWLSFSLAYYGANALWQGYMSLYYRHIGFSDGRIGLISAAMALCALAVQPLWGTLGDRSGKTRVLLAGLALASALVLPLALLNRAFWWQLAFAGLFYAFYCALLPMGDAILLQSLNREKLSFGPYRLAGAVSFALSGAIFGRILEKTAPSAVVWCSAALLLLSSIAALQLPDNRKKQKKALAFKALFRNRDLILLLAFMIPVQMTMGYFYTFFAPHFSALKGGNSSLLGLGYALATVSELPYLIFSDRIYRKFGAAGPMWIAALVLMLRWILLGAGESAAVALASQLLHGGGFIVMTVSMAKYISHHVDENLQSSGQMLLNMASFGIARVAGNLGGGFLADRIGSSKVFFISSGICLASAALFLPKVLRSRS